MMFCDLLHLFLNSIFTSCFKVRRLGVYKSDTPTSPMHAEEVRLENILMFSTIDKTCEIGLYFIYPGKTSHEKCTPHSVGICAGVAKSSF